LNGNEKNNYNFESTVGGKQMKERVSRASKQKQDDRHYVSLASPTHLSLSSSSSKFPSLSGPVQFNFFIISRPDVEVLFTRAVTRRVIGVATFSICLPSFDKSLDL